LLLLVTAPFAALVALSRVILGLHYPSDVLVGAALGAGLALLSLSI
ncbi:MAG TPA: phosphatase PAP2 family protein, partial [Woeseiaceae bacterium]